MVGKVLWWDDRHQEGQIITAAGMKFYFNYSVIKNWPTGSVKRDAILEFKADSETTHAVCAINVVFPIGEKRKLAQKTYKKQLEL